MTRSLKRSPIDFDLPFHFFMYSWDTSSSDYLTDIPKNLASHMSGSPLALRSNTRSLSHDIQSAINLSLSPSSNSLLQPPSPTTQTRHMSQFLLSKIHWNRQQRLSNTQLITCVCLINLPCSSSASSSPSSSTQCLINASFFHHRCSCE